MAPPAKLNEQEWPYLIFPLGDLDDDPADLIRFEGLLPMPVETDEGLHDHWRARITIDFFDLHSEELVIDRADQIVTLFIALETASNPDQSAQIQNLAAEIIARRTAASAAHSACTRAFHRLWLDPETRDRAKAIAEQARKLLAMQA